MCSRVKDVRPVSYTDVVRVHDCTNPHLDGFPVAFLLALGTGGDGGVVRVVVAVLPLGLDADLTGAVLGAAQARPLHVSQGFELGPDSMQYS